MSNTDFYTLNCRGRILSLDHPQIMGILNVTPDSFSDGGQFLDIHAALSHCKTMVEQGATIIDVGGYSSRPGAADISIGEESDRVLPVIEAISKELPETYISIDTFRHKIASEAIKAGAHIINDISAGDLDGEMLELVASLRNVPYIMMHMQGTPQTMQKNPSYSQVVQDVWMYFVEKIKIARRMGIKDLILDPGFGFGKTIAHNFQLLAGMGEFSNLDCPVLAGISRKSFIYKVTGTSPAEADTHSQVLHDHALRAGVNILRVHNVEEAARTLKLYHQMQTHGAI